MVMTSTVAIIHIISKAIQAIIKGTMVRVITQAIRVMVTNQGILVMVTRDTQVMDTKSIRVMVTMDTQVMVTNQGILAQDSRVMVPIILGRQVMWNMASLRRAYLRVARVGTQKTFLCLLLQKSWQRWK